MPVCNKYCLSSVLETRHFCCISFLLLSILVLPGFMTIAATRPSFSSNYRSLLITFVNDNDNDPQFPVDDNPKSKKRCHRWRKGSVLSMFSI